MFRKLRNNFLIMNCIIIGALVFGSFGTHFLVVYQGVRMSVDKKLDTELHTAQRRIYSENTEFPAKRDAPPETNSKTGFGLIDFFISHRSAFTPAFSVVTDKNGSIKDVKRVFNISDAFYEKYAAKITESGKNNGKFRYTESDGSVSKWSYKVLESEDGFIIAFAETSAEFHMLRMLAAGILIVALAASILTLLISRFFANRSIKPIETAYNKQRQFVADASHELKTPLATIITNIDVLLARDTAQEDEKKWLTYIKDEAVRMSKLTNDLLYLARTDVSTESEAYDAVSCTDAVNRVLMLMEARIFERGITLDTNIADGIYISAPEDRLSQLAMILIDNAVKYTPQEGTITVTLEKKASDAVMSVQNTGEGIPAEDLPCIFDRFYRSDKARTYTENSGYGLGLAIAKAVTQSLNGTITAKSADGITEFTVRLPLAKRRKKDQAV